MTIYYVIVFFLLGTIFGSFYNVVAYRLPKGESILFPASHCPKCNHRLTPIELIPIFSFLIQRGKCKKCKAKISWFYTIFEIFTGILFALSYLVYGFSWDLVLALLFCSMVDIIIISDYQTFIIPDEVLVVFSLLIMVFLYIKGGFTLLGQNVLQGILAFIVMYLIKLLGDFLFKRESMGGGDIKLLFVFGLTLGFPMAIVSIFLGSIVGLPISYFLVNKTKEHIIPFGPFLGIGALIILFTKLDFTTLIHFLT